MPFKLCLRVSVLVLYAVIACRAHECEVYDQEDLSVIGRCKELIKGLESALLANDKNLYILHEVFLYDPPTLLYVEYKITYTRGNHTSQTSILLGWTSSSVFTVVDPIMIVTLETGMPAFTLFLGTSNTHMPQITLWVNTTNASLDVLSYTEDELSYALETITARLQEYAYRGEENLERSRKIRGYSWETKHESTVIQAEIFILIFSFFGSFKLLFWLIKQLQSQDTVQFFPPVFWGLTVVLPFWNLLDIIFNFRLVAILMEYEKFYGCFKLIMLLFMLFFGLIWMMCGCLMAPTFTSLPKCVFPFCCTCFCSRRRKARFLYCCGFFQLALFGFFTAANFVPVLILIFVHPVIVLSIVILVITTVLSTVIWATLPFTANVVTKLRSPDVSVSRRTKVANWICYLFAFNIFNVVVYHLISVYLKILWRSAESDDYFKIVFTIVPSAILTVTLFFIKRKFFSKQNGADQDKLESRSESTFQTQVSLVSEDVEEGRGDTDIPEVIVDPHDRGEESSQATEPLETNSELRSPVHTNETAL